MTFEVGQTVIGSTILTDSKEKQNVGIVVDHQEMESEGPQTVSLLMVKFQNINSEIGIYLSTDYETRLLSSSSAPCLIKPLRRKNEL